jgi:GNAT superfamily N-acetyltransferase
MNDLTLSQADSHGSAFEQYVTLLTTCFVGTEGRFTRTYLKWLYRQNPDGVFIGADALHGERLAAHYACIPIHARLHGSPVRMLLSLNTATHPDYQGRGLFTRLAELTYEIGARHGFAGVVGIANANSTPGFVRKLGFQLVTPLRAMIGVGSLGLDPVAVRSRASDFTRVWSSEALGWRLSNPLNAVRPRRREHGLWDFVASTGKPGLSVWSERPEEPGWSVSARGQISDRLGRVFVGLFPPGSARSRFYVEIPRILRPVPLNLIYRPIAPGAPAQVSPEKVFIDFLDFDAF